MTPPTVTSQDLRERLADAERELQDAERALGSVVLDGGDEQAASDRVASSRAALERLKAALGEVGDRRERDSEARRQRQVAVRRWRELAWYAEFVKRLQPVLRLREQLDAAEEHVIALGSAAGAAGQSAISYSPPNGIRLPSVASTDPNEDRFQRRVRANDGLLTVKDCEEWAERLVPLLEEAAKSAGADAKPENLPWS